MTLTTINLAALGDTINLSTEVTGTLPTGNGGTGSTATTFVNAATNVTGTLPVPNGGTGLASGTTDQLLKFTGSTTLASSAISTGKVKQIVNASMSSTVNQTSSSPSTILTLSFNPTSASSLVAVFCNVGTQLYGNTTTTNPGGYFIINKEDVVGGTNSDICAEYYNTNGLLNTNASYISIPACLNAVFTAGVTTQIDLYLRYKTNGLGRIQAFGNNESNQDNPTRLIAVEYAT